MFPKDFRWGAATASYQIEGGWQEGGKGLSIWDAFSHIPGRIADGDTGDTACDHYHRFRDDVALMKSLGLTAYRFSISWPRIQPDGRGKANAAGVRFYSDLIDCLLEHGIEPWATLYHWDLPLALQMEMDGWLNPGLADLFAEYADLCFAHFGDRVKHWMTFNEPWCTAVLGHGLGVLAPGRTSSAEPYRAAHTMLVAHARAVERLRGKHAAQKGQIGMANCCDWREPLTDGEADRAAAQRSLEFFLGWFADPLYRGDYPEVMRRRVGGRLPKFTPEEQLLLAGSCDFFALNTYSTLLASALKPDDGRTLSPYCNAGLVEDQAVFLEPDPAWEETAMVGKYNVPWGCRKMLEWVDARYAHPPVYVTENGCACEEPDRGRALHDAFRVKFLEGYLAECAAALHGGVDLRGYFVWSLLDNFEWCMGYGMRFGMVRVEFDTLQRIPKASARRYASIIAEGKL